MTLATMVTNSRAQNISLYAAWMLMAVINGANGLHLILLNKNHLLAAAAMALSVASLIFADLYYRAVTR